MSEAHLGATTSAASAIGLGGFTRPLTVGACCPESRESCERDCGLFVSITVPQRGIRKSGIRHNKYLKVMLKSL